jgi:hypothetical protein
VSFEQHIRPLFRERDRKSMKFAFDLWNHADVKEHADGILARLSDGSRPCDGALARRKDRGLQALDRDRHGCLQAASAHDARRSRQLKRLPPTRRRDPITGANLRVDGGSTEAIN